MPIYELYYTSSKPQHANQGGYQVRAQSPGISKAQRAVLDKMMGYKHPPGYDEYTPATHPVAMRYLPIDAHSAALVCSQSTGEDDNGRPGNYFAHSMVGDMSLLSRDEQLPPIVYWQNPFWRKHDPDARPERDSLPVHDDLIVSTGNFDFDAAWAFLETDHRRTWFRKLLAALVSSDRKIIIRDTVEHVVVWIYALSLTLPPRLRNLLSFSTYHHDPLTTPFRINGIVPEQTLRPGDYFMLDAIDLNVTDAPPSTFADFAADHMTESGFNETLLDLNHWLQKRLRHAEHITPALNHLTDFFLTEKQGRLARDWQRSVAGAAAVVESVPARHLAADDRDDIHAAWVLAGDALTHIHSTHAWSVYNNAVAAAKTVGLSAEELYPRMALHLAGALTAGNWQAVGEIGRLLHTDGQLDALNHPDALAAVELGTLAHAQRFWDGFGPALNFAGNTHHLINPLIDHTLDLLDAEAQPNPFDVPETAARLVRALVLATGEDRRLVLNQAALWAGSSGRKHAFYWLYYALVEPLNVPRRAEAFWMRYWNQFDDLHSYELRRDRVKLRNTDDVADHVLRWLNALSDPIWRDTVLHDALDVLYGGVQQDHFARRLLAEEVVTTTINPDWYATLLSDGLMGVMIARIDKNTAQTYTKFVQEVMLNPTDLAVLEGSLAIYHGTLPQETVAHLNQRFAQLEDDRVYEQEMLALAEVFFAAETHAPFVQATYVRARRLQFWNVYWSLFKDMLERGDAGRMVDILRFWFAGAGDLYMNAAFVVPEFFAQLGTVFAELQNNRTARNHLTTLDDLSKKEPWYDVLAPLLAKGGRRGLFGGLLG